MFDDELAVVEESFRGLGRARAGGVRAGEQCREPPPEGAKEEEEKEEPAVDINLLFTPNFHGPVPY